MATTATNDPKAQALAKQDETLQGFLNARMTHIKQVAASIVTPERMVKLTLLAAKRTPQLEQCNFGSVLLAVMDLARLGLEPGGPMGQAALVPFKDECTPIIMYQGWIELMHRSGMILDAQTDVVYEGDTWDYRRGDEPRLLHIPSDDADREQREWHHVYCVIRTKGGGILREVMSKAAVMKIKARSRSSGNTKSPWNTDETEMARKTVLRRAVKYAPKSVEMREAAEIDSDLDADVVDGVPVGHKHGGVAHLRKLATDDVPPVPAAPAAQATPPASPASQGAGTASAPPPQAQPQPSTVQACVAPDCPREALPARLVCDAHKGADNAQVIEWVKSFNRAHERTAPPAAARKRSPAAQAVIDSNEPSAEEKAEILAREKAEAAALKD